jgi:lysophospholipase L1-like esterase
VTAVAAAVALAAGIAAATAPASVLVVGDSLGVGTEAPLRGALAEVDVEADNVGGRTSSQGLEVLRGLIRPEHEAVVFDLGTNDGTDNATTTAASLAAARAVAGDRCLAIATLNRPPVGGVPVDGQNAAIRDFAVRTPTVVLVDWEDAALAIPEVLQPDGVHGTAYGYALRGALFADALRGCLAGGGGFGAGPADPGGSQTDVPAQPASVTRTPAARRTRVARSGPSLERRLLRAVGARVAEGASAGLLAAGAATVAAAAEHAVAVLAPRGPEPVLGAS